jgi:PurA ssDNA and RNA-binding protein
MGRTNKADKHRSKGREAFEDFPAPIPAFIPQPSPPVRRPSGAVSLPLAPPVAREVREPREGESPTVQIASASFRGDGKIFYLDAIKNERGLALRIAEVSKGKRTTVLVPATLIADFELNLAKVTPLLVQ